MKKRESTEWVVSYSYNANLNDLPRVLLVGDSICNGYQTTTRDALSGIAHLSFYASSKCVTDVTYLRELSFFLDEYRYAVIHFNNGLHSLNTDSLAWERGLISALKLIQKYANGAKIIWATSTPTKKPGETQRIVEINSVAERIMLREKVPINDLFSFMNPMDRNRYWIDNCHYNDEAKTLQGKKVAQVILSALDRQSPAPAIVSPDLKSFFSETGPDGRIAS